MSTKTVRFLLIAVIVSQFLWLIILPAGNRLSPKSPAMVQALRAFEANRTPVSEAAMWEQVRRDELHDARKSEAIFSSMLLADAVAIYLFWNFGVKRPTA